METVWTEELLLRCCWSKRFAKEMVAASPFPDYDRAVESARHIWFNKIDVNGWLEAFAAHPQIGGASSSISQWSKEEQSTAAATAHDSTLRELAEWNARYREKFGFVFLICATGRSTQEILAELKKRYPNRPIVELEVAALEKMKIIELQLARLFKFDALSNPSGTTQLGFVNPSIKAGEIKLHSGNHQRLMNTLTSKIKAHWTPEFHKLFVTLCLDQVVAGNKPGTHLNKKGWKYVMDKFYERTGILYDKKQFQNHWDSTKDQWKVWNKLKSDLAGYDFDTHSQTVNMSDDWWANYIQMHPEATQFRQKGLPLADLLDILFSGARTDRIGVIGAHLAATPLVSANRSLEILSCSRRNRPPITTHVLDVARGCPASGMEVQLEKWKGTGQFPSFTESCESTEWVIMGSSKTDVDGRSGPLMKIIDHIAPGFYRIQFNTGKYAPSGFFPFVSIVFEVKANQTSEHFHVPLLYSPFSFTTYRGS